MFDQPTAVEEYQKARDTKLKAKQEKKSEVEERKEGDDDEDNIG